MLYRLLGHEGVTLTRKQVEDLVRRGLLTADTMVIGDGETFAAPVGARAEFEHLKRQRETAAPDDDTS